MKVPGATGLSRYVVGPLIIFRGDQGRGNVSWRGSDSKNDLKKKHRGGGEKTPKKQGSIRNS